MNGPEDILDLVYDLLAPDGAWCQGFLAVSETGPCDLDDPELCSRCLVGAFTEVRNRLFEGVSINDGDEANNIINDLTRAKMAFRIAAGIDLEFSTGNSIPKWQDAPGRTKAEVLAKLKEAKTCIPDIIFRG